MTYVRNWCILHGCIWIARTRSFMRKDEEQKRIQSSVGWAECTAAYGTFCSLFKVSFKNGKWSSHLFLLEGVRACGRYCYLWVEVKSSSSISISSRSSSSSSSSAVPAVTSDPEGMFEPVDWFAKCRCAWKKHIWGPQRKRERKREYRRTWYMAVQ